MAELHDLCVELDWSKINLDLIERQDNTELYDYFPCVISTNYTEYLKHFKIPIVRVYSKSIESREFSVPGEPALTGKLESADVAMDPRHETISLHHLIRRNTNTRGAQIRQFDMRFRKKDYKPSRPEVKAYFKLISVAEVRISAMSLVIKPTWGNLKEYYEIVGESRPLSAIFPTHAFFFTEMHFYSWN